MYHHKITRVRLTRPSPFNFKYVFLFTSARLRPENKLEH